MERWSKFDTEGVRLAKIRIYKPQSATPRIVVFVPPEDGNGSDGDEDIYELDMVNQNVENQVAIAERAKAPSGTGRARTTIMTGQIKHECNLRPRMTGRYERRLMERGAAANDRSMRVGLMDGARAGRGGGKMLSSGITSASGFADIAVSTESISVCLSPLHSKVRLFSFSFTARKEQAGKGPERTYDAYASQPTARCALCTLPRARAMAHQALA
jgi:transcription initiation factor TFIIF subunit beta